MNKKADLFFRYAILLVAGFFGSHLFYLSFTPLTIYPVFFILKLFYPATQLLENTLVIANSSIILIPACIAGAAYYLLLIVNLATPMKLKTRLKSLFFMFVSFLFLNIARIILFSALFVSGFKLFDIAHKIVWDLASTLFIVLLWFLAVHSFKIKNIPVYTDFKTLLEYRKGRLLARNRKVPYKRKKK